MLVCEVDGLRDKPWGGAAKFTPVLACVLDEPVPGGLSLELYEPADGDWYEFD